MKSVTVCAIAKKQCACVCAIANEDCDHVCHNSEDYEIINHGQQRRLEPDTLGAPL